MSKMISNPTSAASADRSTPRDAGGQVTMSSDRYVEYTVSRQQVTTYHDVRESSQEQDTTYQDPRGLPQQQDTTYEDLRESSQQQDTTCQDVVDQTSESAEGNASVYVNASVINMIKRGRMKKK